MSKVAIGILIGVLVAIAIFASYLYGKGSLSLSGTPSPTPSPISQATSTPAPTQTPSPVSSSSPSDAETGTATGKLCFPSQGIPAGKIEAKRLSDKKVFSQSYPGTQNGGGTTYDFELEKGVYNLRLFIDEKLSGYHTITCPTGLETSCAADNAREHINVEIVPGETVEKVDLCDFYYSDKTKPSF